MAPTRLPVGHRPARSRAAPLPTRSTRCSAGPGPQSGLIGRRGRMAGRLGEYIGIARLARPRSGTDERAGAAPPCDGARAGTPVAGAGYRASSRRSGKACCRSGTRSATDTATGRSTRPRRSPLPSTSCRRRPPPATRQHAALTLLDHYELLVPGTRTMVRYLSLQPLYRSHPLRSLLTGPGVG